MTPSTALRIANALPDARPADRAQAALSRLTDLSREFAPDLSFSIHTNFETIESEWRSFQEIAECTAFQTFEWLATWQRHVGARNRVTPVIVVGHFADGKTAFIAPFAIERGRLARRLTWLGQELCDYNAPLLARDFSQRVTTERFLALWRDVQKHLRLGRQLRYDWIAFEKMPQTVGVQPNPFVNLPVIANANSAHITQLGGDWETFYRERRSSATRRRDRTKRKRVAAFGDIRFATATEADDLNRTLETLWEQKKRIFARKGIGDLFSQPGYREFFADFATNPQTAHLAHVSRLDVGGDCAAANFAVAFSDCYYHVLSSYCDGQLTRFGPGVLHLRELLAHAIARGFRRFDFTIGDEDYKLEWSDLRLRLFDYSAAANLRGWPTSLLFAALRPVKRFIKQTPLLWRTVCRLRALVGPLLHRDLADKRPAVQTSTAPAIPACVMGDMDLLRPLAAAGIPAAVVARPGVPSLYSRSTRARLHWDVAQTDGQRLDALIKFGAAQGERPVLFYEEDEQVLFISRHRERLSQAFRFVIADATLVENLLDKARFTALAQRHGLPVPPTVAFHPATTDPVALAFDFPVVIKPLTRLDRWNDILGLRKAIAVESADALRQLWPQLLTLDIDLLAQKLVPGAESRMESYHCYVDAQGSIAAEFTGRKIRTYPVTYGHSTALRITDTADLRALGRDIVERIGLTGVAKLDFKRDDNGKPHLFEINPRFTLWHHAGAAAGINIPALVYADLTGTPRPVIMPPSAGVRWCRLWSDWSAARDSGVPFRSWLPWALNCEAKSALSWNDPMPIVRAALHRVTERIAGRNS